MRISKWALVLFAVLFLAVNVHAEEAKIVRESTEWCRITITRTNDTKTPRVLMIGDSIVIGYFANVDKALKGKANCAYLATSKSVGDPAFLAEVRLVLSQSKFDVIHFNNGLHGWGYTESDYKKHFPELLATLKKHGGGAKLIWATITPMRKRANLKEFHPKTERVIARNKIAKEYAAKEKIQVNDLFSLVEKHTEYFSADGVHFSQKGKAAQGAQVAEYVLKCLK